jgi:hypothetical protein
VDERAPLADGEGTGTVFFAGGGDVVSAFGPAVVECVARVVPCGFVVVCALVDPVGSAGSCVVPVVDGAVTVGESEVTAPVRGVGGETACLTVLADATPTNEPAAATAKPAASATKCLRTLAAFKRTRCLATPGPVEISIGAGSAIATRPSATSENTACGYSTTSSDMANDARHNNPPGDSFRHSGGWDDVVALRTGSCALLAPGWLTTSLAPGGTMSSSTSLATICSIAL